jgi:hypothetical protein
MSRTSAVVLAIILAAPSAFAAVPNTITQQGRLLNTDGTPATGTVMMTFSLYADGTTATNIWTETQSVTLDDGYFSVQLGSMTSFTPPVFDGSARFLGLKVGTDSEMTPREEVTSVPYAFMAQNAVGDITPTSLTIGGASGAVIQSDGTVKVGGVTIINPNGTLAIGAGSQGPSGPAGVQGPSGPAGPSGPNGGLGPSGPAGVQGPSGPTGGAGVQGPSGPTGGAGVAGPSGPAGVQGPSGPTGGAGVAGPSGPLGPSGPNGPQGPSGPNGVAGLGADSYALYTPHFTNATTALTGSGSFPINSDGILSISTGATTGSSADIKNTGLAGECATVGNIGEIGNFMSAAVRWFPHAANQTGYILHGSLAEGGFGIKQDTADKLFGVIRRGATDDLLDLGMTTTNFEVVAIVRAANQVEFFINGVSKGILTGAGNIPTCVQNMYEINVTNPGVATENRIHMRYFTIGRKLR